MNERQLKPQIRVVCVNAQGDYIAGAQAWIDATQPLEQLQETVVHLIARVEPLAREWGIIDSQDFGMPLDFNVSLETVHHRALLLRQHGHALIAACSIADDFEMAHRRFMDDYVGVYPNRRTFAVGVFQAQYPTLPEAVLYYIDYQSFQHDLFSRDGEGYQAIDIEGRTHVFRNRDQ